VFWEGDIDAAAAIHQDLLDLAFLDHGIHEQRVFARVIEVKPLIISPNRDGAF
jgi:hypothetical protein